MKKSKWLDCQGNEFFPKQKGTPSLVKIEHKNTATLDSARSKKKSKVAVLQLYFGQMAANNNNNNKAIVVQLQSFEGEGICASVLKKTYTKLPKRPPSARQRNVMNGASLAV